MDKLKKTSDEQGFTLAELLVVVAIIAILIAVSIPILSAQLERSREATDVANMRAAKALLVEYFYEGVTDSASASKVGMSFWGNPNNANCNAYGVYDPNKGIVVSGYGSVHPYGKGTAADGGSKVTGYVNTVDYTKAVINVCIYPKANPPYAEIAWKTVKNDLSPDKFLGWSSGSYAKQVIYLK
ncbi:MAG: type II secretion system GspH family protein [Lachnospiraceae bacterium]|nr:type II secretion system GspH family protein [Lachnospiraceae bacterium]